jgi:[acyl-carrier-protein] S-malonyltransferase
VTAAWVDGVPVPAADVDAEVARLRAGPLAARLPAEGPTDGRQLRRWVTQRVVLRRLLDHEAATRGRTRDDPVARPDPALVGSAAADVLATSAAARAVLATFGARPEEQELRAHYVAHPDRYARPERWLVRQAFLPARTEAPPADQERAAAPAEQERAAAPADQERVAAAAEGTAAAPAELETALAAAAPTEVDPATLVPELRAAPAGPVRSRLGWHQLVVEEIRPAGPIPYDHVRAGIEAELTARYRQLAFARWLDAAVAARVRLAPGYEHPADPRQPDATHRH